jgi:hypothetical protein
VVVLREKCLCLALCGGLNAGYLTVVANPSLKANTTSFALKTSTKDSTEGSHIRPLTEPVRTLQLTNVRLKRVVISGCTTP